MVLKEPILSVTVATLNPPPRSNFRQQPDLLETPEILNSSEASCDRCCAQRRKNWVWRQMILLQVASSGSRYDR